jgi:peptidyl-prolyl cis-trans isomerase C
MKQRRAWLLPLCPFFVLFVSAFVSFVSAQAPETLARIGDREVSVDQFRMVLSAMREAGRVDSTLQTVTAAGRERLLDALVERDLYAIAAREDELDRQADVRFWIDQAVGEVLAKAYLERAAQQVDVTDDALHAFYDAHHDLFVKPSRVKARHIVVASRTEADAALAEIANGRAFADVATQRSIDAGTRPRGGDLGWVTRGVMVKPFEDRLFSLERGEVGGPIETSLGFHVVTVDDVEAPALPAFDAVKQTVRERKIAAELGELKARLLARHPVTIQRDALASLGR